MAHRVAPEAEAELDNIWYYVAKDNGSIEIADRLIDSIPRASTFWPVFRTSDASRDEDLRTGLRSFPVGEYVIIYRPEGEDALILHVLRGGRDIEALLRQ